MATAAMQTEGQDEKFVLKHLESAMRSLDDAKKPMPFVSHDAERLDNLRSLVREVYEDIRSDGVQ